MAAITLTLDDLCAELSRVFEQVNRDLPAISEQKGTDATQVFSYRLPHQATYELLTIPYDKFHRNHGYSLQDFIFSLPCYLTTRKFNKESQVVLMLQTPNWWQKIRHPHVLKHLEIQVAKDGTNLALGPGKAMRPKRSRRNWIFLLTEDQQSKFSSLIPDTSWWRSSQKIWRKFWTRKIE